MQKSNNVQIEQNLLDKGLNIIICAFNEQKKEYAKNLLQLESELKKLKEENFIYKNKLTILQQKLNTLSKTVCDLDIESEESKNQMEKKLMDSKKMMATVNNEFNNIYRNRKKNNSVSNKFSLYKNFLLQNKNINAPEQPQGEAKTLNHKAFSNNYHFNLKGVIDSNKTSYNKAIGSLHYLKRNKITSQNDNSFAHNSFLVENTPKDVDANLFEESRTDRDFYKRRMFSEKDLKISKKKRGKNYNNNKKELLLNNNNTKIYNTNNYNEFILNNNSDLQKNGDDTYQNKNDNENENSNTNSNACSKKTSESEIYFKDMKISGDNNSKLYKKLNVFLEECKIKLNALDYENVIELLKSFEIDSNIDVRKKVKKILNNNQKLCKLFDSIFEV